MYAFMDSRAEEAKTKKSKQKNILRYGNFLIHARIKRCAFARMKIPAIELAILAAIFSNISPAGQATELLIFAGNNQFAIAGSAVPGAVCIIVKDAQGKAVPGVSITWGNVTGGGSITGAAQSTDSTGIATLGGWTLGTSAGANTITATSPGLQPVTFTATAVQPTQMSIVHGNNQTAVIGTPVLKIVRVVVKDANDNPVPGIVVTWGNVTGGGSIGGAVQTTNQIGVATLGNWTLGPDPGVNTIVATSPGLPSCTFTATGIVGQPAQFASPPSTPEPVVAGEPVILSAVSTPSASAVMTWDFGDGTTGTGFTVTHIYTAPGLYHVKITLSDHTIISTEFTNVAVNPHPPDDIAGSGKVPNIFTVQRGILRFDFTKPNNDQITLSGCVPVPKNFAPAGKSISLAIGPLMIDGTLDGKGMSADRSFMLKVKSSAGTFQGTPARFTVTQKNTALFDKLQPYGFTNADVRTRPLFIDVPVLISVDGIGYVSASTFVYTARAKKSGLGKASK